MARRSRKEENAWERFTKRMFPGISQPRTASRRGMNAKTDQDQNWITPPWLVGEVERLAGGKIDLDPCAGPSVGANPLGARVAFTESDNGLFRSWIEIDPTVRIVYVNPPYKRQAEWVEKVIEETERSERRLSIWLLGPAFSDQPWYGRALSWATSEWSIKGRVRFLRPDGRPATSPRFPTVLFGFGTVFRDEALPVSVPALRNGTWVVRGVIERPLDKSRDRS